MKKQIKNQKGVAPLVIVIIAGLVLAIGGVGTAAADNSKPGDALHGIDIAIEKTRIALTFDVEAKAELHTEHAAERVAEIKALLDEKGVTAPGIDVALANLIGAKRAVADLATTEAKLEVKAKALDDAFELQEEELEQAFDEAKRPLKLQKKQLKLDLLQALRDGDTEEAAAIQVQIADIKAQLKVLEVQEEIAEDALDLEEDRLEALLEAEEATLEAEEERLEEEEELAEEELERMEEELERKLKEERKLQEEALEAEEEERERLEKEAKKTLEEAEELQKEIEDFEEENGLED